MNVGKVSQETGLPIKTLHYYEEIKLVVPNRQENGYRVYNTQSFTNSPSLIEPVS